MTKLDIDRASMNRSLRALIFGGAVMSALVSGPSAAHATPFYGYARTLTNFIWTSQFMQAGTTYTLEIRNATSGGDPVMHVLLGSTQVAFDDDSNGSLQPRVVYKPTTSGTYTIWVRDYSSTASGKGDLYINGAVALTQAAFGGSVENIGWNAGEHFRVAGTQRGGGNDTMLFLLRSNGQYLQHDDDSGPNNYSTLNANSTETSSSRAVWGLYPGSVGAAHLIKDDCVSSSCPDTDGDSIPDALETAIGTSPTKWDTDADGMIDVLELYGNDGFSFSEGNATISNAVHRNIYVEVDYMVGVGTSQNKKPYAGLAADIATIFATDGNTRVDVFVDTQLPWHRVISYGTCPAGSDCVRFDDVRAANFAPTDIYKLTYFRYAVFANNVTASNDCHVGASQPFYTNMIVALDSTFGGCGRTFSAAEQRGAFMHMLGHQLGLDDGGNDNPVNNSVVYQSVMNKRYMLSGVPNRSAPLAHTYSFGQNGGQDCETSPKQTCIDLRNVPGDACNHAGFSCDIDQPDWVSFSLIGSTTPTVWTY